MDTDNRDGLETEEPSSQEENMEIESPSKYDDELMESAMENVTEGEKLENGNQSEDNSQTDVSDTELNKDGIQSEEEDEESVKMFDMDDEEDVDDDSLDEDEGVDLTPDNFEDNADKKSSKMDDNKGNDHVTSSPTDDGESVDIRNNTGKQVHDFGVNTDSLTDSASENEDNSQGNDTVDGNGNDSTLTNGDENGIVINENDIVKAEDMYGRGKRVRLERKSKDYISNDDEKGENDAILENIHREQNYAKSPQTSKRSPNLRKSEPKIARRTYVRNFDEEKVLLPFKHGWTRELVMRNVFDKYTDCGTPKHRPADVYYHPPTGRKLRSMKEIADFLRKTDSPFTEDNFSLLRQPISEPPYEVVRHAGKSKCRSTRKRNDSDEMSFKDDDDTSFDTPEVVIERADEDEDEQEKETVATTKPLTSTPTPQITVIPVIRKQAKIKVTPMRFGSKMSMKGKPPKNRTVTKTLVYHHSRSLKVGHKITETLIKDVPVFMPDFSSPTSDSEDSSIHSPPAKKHKATARKSTTQKSFKPSINHVRSKTEALCNLFCPGQENIPPSLQCIVCLCLFHPSCVAFSPSENRDFICLRCLNPSVLEPKSTTVAVQKHDQFQPFTRPIAIMKLAAPIQVRSSLKTSSPAQLPIPVTSIKQEPVDLDLTSAAPLSTMAATKSHQEMNPTLLEQLRSSILDRHVVTTVAARTVSVLTPGQLSQMTHVPRTSIVQLQSTRAPATSNLPNLSLLTNTVRGLSPRPPGTVFMTPSGVMTHVNHANPKTILVPASLLGNAQVVGSSMPRLVAPVPQMHFVSPTPATPSLRTPQLSMAPPRLIAAPKTPPAVLETRMTSPVSSPVTTGTMSAEPHGVSGSTKSGQILMLPGPVSKRLNLQQPLALKINNVQITVPPSSFLYTAEGLKLFLPPKTFPLQQGETAKLSVTVTNDKSSNSPAEVRVSVSTTNVTESSSLGVLKPLSADPPATSTSTLDKSVCDSTPDKSGRKTRNWKTGINPGMCYVKKLYGGFDCMFCIFHYLNMKDLLRVSMVCRTWRQLAMHPSHWRTLRLKNLKILDWEKAMDFMLLRAVQTLNLRGLVHDGDQNRTWLQLISHIHKLTCVRQLSFGLVPASVLLMGCEKVPNLELLRAEMITDITSDQMWTVSTKLDIGKFSSMKQLQELRLRGVGGLNLPAFSFSGGLSELGTMKNLKVLSLTSLKEMDDHEFGFLSDLTNLETLELGYCSSWSSETYYHLGRLSQLKSLRLESGGEIPDVGLGDALLNMKQLERLELIMFVVAESLHVPLGQLHNLRHLGVWPDTSSQPAALVNSHLLAVVSKLAKLKRLEWGILEDKEKALVCDRNDNTDTRNLSRSEWIPFLSAGVSVDGADVPENAPIQYMSVHEFTEKLAIIHPTTNINVFCTEMLNARKSQTGHEDS